MSKAKSVLNFSIDSFRCANILTKDLPIYLNSLSHFKSLLEHTENECREADLKSIFLNIPQDRSMWISDAVNAGFDFLYVQDKELCLIKKLRPNHVPIYATHHVGAGGVVFSPDFKQVLASQGRGLAKYCTYL